MEENVILTQSPVKLTEESKLFICNLWENDLHSIEENTPKRFRDVVNHLFTICDVHGVVFGSIEELANGAKISLAQTRKSLHLLEKYNLVLRKHAITIITDRRNNLHFR